MLDPQSMSPGSIMPSYPWLLDDNIDTAITAKMVNAMRTLGVPYADGYESRANHDLMQQAKEISSNLKSDKIETPAAKEIIALIAYMQRLGKDIKGKDDQLVENLQPAGLIRDNK